MILSGQTIRSLCCVATNKPMHRLDDELEPYVAHPMVDPFVERSVHESGMSFGLSVAGYDIRLDKMVRYAEEVTSLRIMPGDFVLASSVERIKMPNDVIAFVKDKSSWARKGLAVQNTVLEPGWEGFITLELSFHRPMYHIDLKQGMPIAQVIFQRLDEPAEKPYNGKYQNQEARPVEAKEEVIPNNSTVKTLELDSAEQEALDALR